MTTSGIEPITFRLAVQSSTNGNTAYAQVSNDQ